MYGRGYHNLLSKTACSGENGKVSNNQWNGVNNDDEDDDTIETQQTGDMILKYLFALLKTQLRQITYDQFLCNLAILLEEAVK